MKVCVTGGAGFIGSHLIDRLLDEGCMVASHEDRDSLPKVHMYDQIVHLGAIADVRRSVDHPDEYYDLNAEYTRDLQRRCNEENVPLIYASSSTAANWHMHPYGASKKMNELTAYPDQIGLRFTTVYGHGARASMFVTRLLTGKLEYVTEHHRDFVHVDDVVEAIMRCIWQYEELEGVYNICTGYARTPRELAEVCGLVLPVKAGGDMEAETNVNEYDRFYEVTGWEPEIDIEDWLKENYIENPDNRFTRHWKNLPS